MRSCLPSPKRCKSSSPSVGEYWFEGVIAALPLLTRGLLTLCVFAPLRELIALASAPLLTGGPLPRFGFCIFVMRASAPVRAKISAARRIVRKYLRRFPSQVDCFLLPSESQESVRAPEAVATVPSSR